MKTTILCSSTEEFDSLLEDALRKSESENSQLFVLFTGKMKYCRKLSLNFINNKHLLFYVGSKTSDTGKSWCPDCVRAEPILEEAFESNDGGSVVLLCPVDRAPYKQSDFPYRQNPSIQLSCVPTLLKWGRSGPAERLNDNECQNVKTVFRFVSGQ